MEGNNDVKAQRLARWCALLGVDATAVAAHLSPCTSPLASSSRGVPAGVDRDDAAVLPQIRLDVPRSCHFDACTSWGPPERAAHLSALQRVLAATFPLSHQHEFPFYVQGAHDVAAVLLLAVGEPGATLLLPHLVEGPIRGFLQPDMSVPCALLTSLLPLIRRADAALGRHVEAHVGGHGVWALPWLLTWMSHSVASLDTATALFEGCLGRHPLRPVYLAAAVALRGRAHLLTVNEEGPLMMALQRLPAGMTVEEAGGALALADALQAECPPLLLLCTLLCPPDRSVLARGWPHAWTAREGAGDRVRVGGAAAHLLADVRWRGLVLSGYVPPPHGVHRWSVVPNWVWPLLLAAGLALLSTARSSAGGHSAGTWVRGLALHAARWAGWTGQ